MIEILIIGVCVCAVILYTVRRIVDFLYHCNYVNKHEHYILLLDKILEKAYESVYKAQVVAYSASAIRPENEQLETIKRNYIKLAFQLMGPNLEGLLILFYGDRNTLIKAMIVFMETRLDNDSILDYVKRVQDETDGDGPSTKGLIPEGMQNLMRGN